MLTVESKLKVLEAVPEKIAPDLFDRVLKELSAGRKIEAVKELHGKATYGLKRSKDIIDMIESLMDKELNKAFVFSGPPVQKEKSPIQIRIDRTSDGLNLYLKSYILEAFIRKTTVRPDLIDSHNKNLLTNVNWPGYVFYHLPNHPIFTSKVSVGGPLLINTEYGNTANLAPILARGLSDGVTIPFKGLYTEDQIHEFLSKFKLSVKEIYREFMKPFSHTLTFRLEKME